MYAAHASRVCDLGGRGSVRRLLFQVWLSLLIRLWRILVLVRLVTAGCARTACIRVVEGLTLHILFVSIVSSRHCVDSLWLGLFPSLVSRPRRRDKASGAVPRTTLSACTGGV